MPREVGLEREDGRRRERDADRRPRDDHHRDAARRRERSDRDRERDTDRVRKRSRSPAGRSSRRPAAAEDDRRVRPADRNEREHHRRDQDPVDGLRGERDAGGGSRRNERSRGRYGSRERSAPSMPPPPAPVAEPMDADDVDKLAAMAGIDLAVPEPEVDLDAGVTPEEMQMMAAMGIPFGFDTTQGIDRGDEASKMGAVKAKQTRQARQYMNRRGGFNRNLPAERTGERVNLQ